MILCKHKDFFSAQKNPIQSKNLDKIVSETSHQLFTLPTSCIYKLELEARRLMKKFLYSRGLTCIVFQLFCTCDEDYLEVVILSATRNFIQTSSFRKLSKLAYPGGCNTWPSSRRKSKLYRLFPFRIS